MANPAEFPQATPPGAAARLAQTMAYQTPVTTTPYHSFAAYRLSRGFPKFRRGVLVAAIPKFSALTIYSHTSNTPTPFQNAQVGKNISWPVGPK